MTDELLDLCIAYYRFNAARALGTDTDSAFRVESIGPHTAMIDAARGCPGMCNRVIARDALQVEDLPALLSRYDGRLPVLELNAEAPMDDALLAALESLAYQPEEMLMYLCATPQAFPPSSIQVERWGPERADDFIGLLNRSMGSDGPEATWELRRKHYCTDTFRTWVATVDGEPCSWATLYVHGKAGVLANAYTFEAFRNRGCHAALLERRLSDAFDLGLDGVTTDVEQGSVSANNALKYGFIMAGLHRLWVSSPLTDSGAAS